MRASKNRFITHSTINDMNAKIVVGSAFGDEGKGLVVDYLSSLTEQNKLIIRFNGGSQSGHTVVTPNQKQHTFRQVGSGSLCGNCTTYLSEYHIVHPYALVRELDQLNKIGVHPKVIIDPYALLTTPFDVAINQIIERKRGNNKHGSCGFGINETVVRSDKYPLHARDIFDADLIRSTFVEIATHYVPERLHQLGIDITIDDYSVPMIPSPEQVLTDKMILSQVIDNFVTTTYQLSGLISLYEAQPNNEETVIFEGAQGLLLDQNHKFFPHVTRSSTGLTNVLPLMEQMLITDADVYYVTRAYTTRHGVGPFPREDQYKLTCSTKDLTNVQNEFQGALRYGYLDLDLLIESIENDQKHINRQKFNITRNIAITCVDQVEKQFGVYYNYKFRFMTVDQVCTILDHAIKFDTILLSYGRTRNDVHRYK